MPSAKNGSITHSIKPNTPVRDTDLALDESAFSERFCQNEWCLVGGLVAIQPELLARWFGCIEKRAEAFAKKGSAHPGATRQLPLSFPPRNHETDLGDWSSGYFAVRSLPPKRFQARNPTARCAPVRSRVLSLWAEKGGPFPMSATPPEQPPPESARWLLAAPEQAGSNAPALSRHSSLCHC